ncbi:MAG: cell division protein FtsA [Psychrobium sp.]|nr:cell division protein FtsA [Psychrobium sp.]
MSKVSERDLIVGLDIGTSTVKVVIGEILVDGGLSIVGIGSQASKGMEKAGVNDLDSVVKTVQRALDEAELMADCQITSVNLSISGKHIACQNEKGMVSINDDEVTPYDVDNVIHTARSVKISDDRRILHVMPTEYAIDVQEGIKSPIGMSGMRMEAQVHMVTCASDMAKNIEKCVQRCGLEVDELVFSAIASSYAVLTDDEKDLGVCLVDMGGGTMDIAVFTNGSLRHSAVIPVAGAQVTSDIAQIFRTPMTHAEQIKIKHACAMSQLVSQEDNIEVPSVGGRPTRTMSRHTLAEVVEPRYKELFELVLTELHQAGFSDEQVAAGIVLTGGTAKIEGAIDFAEACFGMPVRLASPIPVKGLNDYIQDPSYAAGVGLLHYGSIMRANARNEHLESGGVSLFHRIKNWIKGEF